MVEYLSKAQLAKRFNLPRSRIDMIDRQGQLAGMCVQMGRRRYVDSAAFAQAFGYADDGRNQKGRVIQWRT